MSALCLLEMIFLHFLTFCTCYSFFDLFLKYNYKSRFDFNVCFCYQYCNYWTTVESNSFSSDCAQKNVYCYPRG